jgi:hypothetical protein
MLINEIVSSRSPCLGSVPVLLFYHFSFFASLLDAWAQFGVPADSTGPVFLFWPKGSRLSKPELATGITTSTAFQDWMWERLKVSSYHDALVGNMFIFLLTSPHGVPSFLLFPLSVFVSSSWIGTKSPPCRYCLE